MGNRLQRLNKDNNELFYRFIGTLKLDLDQAANEKLQSDIVRQMRLTKPVLKSLYRKYKIARRKHNCEKNIFHKFFYYLKKSILMSRFSGFNLQHVRFHGSLVTLRGKK